MVIFIYRCLFLLNLIFTGQTYSQVSGISASKIGTFCAGSVPAKDLEFEPSFILENAFAAGGSSGLTSGLAFRFTYGVTDEFEIGMSVPADASESGWGVKHRLFYNDNNGLAAIAGVNLLIDDHSGGNTKDVLSFAGGFCISHEFRNKLLLDIDVQGQMPLDNADTINHYLAFVDTDLGYYINGDTQLILGCSYFSRFGNGSRLNSDLLTINPGLSYESGDNFLMVISSPIGLKGKYGIQNYGINIAFTMTMR
jgi:hypothetical protein